jgi:hypothetical protein
MPVKKNVEQIAAELRRAIQVGRKHVSPREGALLFPISEWTLRDWAYTGKIASVKLGGPQSRLLIPVAEIERVIAEGTRPRTESTAA